MAQCGIMRIEKRGRGAVYGLQIEANRTEDDHKRGRDFDQSDIDWKLTEQNIHLQHTANWNKEITRQIHEAGLKERKNSTVMIDGLYTASADWFETHTQDEAMQYFKDCLDFHVREYCGGDPSRVINAVIHLDETTPHMQVASVPIIEDEKGYHLSAKLICGGRQEFRLHQDRFFEQVSKSRGLERGEVREPAQTKAHTTKREWQIATQAERLEEAKANTEQARKRASQARSDAARAVADRDEAQKAADAARTAQKAAERDSEAARERKRKDEFEAATKAKQLQRTKEQIAEANQTYLKRTIEADEAGERLEKLEFALENRKQSITTANEQKLDALRERDAARANRDMVKALAGLQNAVFKPVDVEVDILAEYEAKMPLWGSETPAAVKIPREDLERLQRQATVNERILQAAKDITQAYNGMKQAARDANENRIDKQAAADRAAISEQGQRADGLERELAQTRQALQQEQKKTSDLSAKLERAKQDGQNTREILAFFPDEWDRMQERTSKARSMEHAYEQRYSSFGKSYVPYEGQDVPIRQFLRSYLEECNAQNLPHERGMKEHLDNLLRRDRAERDDLSL